VLVKIEARILIFPGTGFHFPSTSVPPGTFLGPADAELYILCWTELSRRKLSPTSATAHYPYPDNAIGLLAECETQRVR